MKFCGNCGKQIDDNANACPFCGTMQGGARPQTGGQFGGFQAPKAKAGGLDLPKILMLAGFAVTFLFSFFAFVKVEIWGFSESVNIFGCGFLGILGFLIILGGLAVVIVDAFVKPLGMIPVILGCVQVVWMIILAIYVAVSLGGEVGELAGDAVSKGIGFWFYIIGSLVVAAGTVLSFLGGKRR